MQFMFINAVISCQIINQMKLGIKYNFCKTNKYVQLLKDVVCI